MVEMSNTVWFGLFTKNHEQCLWFKKGVEVDWETCIPLLLGRSLDFCAWYTLASGTTGPMVLQGTNPYDYKKNHP